MNKRASAVRNFLLGGALPIVAFAIVDNFCGTVAGVIAGIVFGGGEIIWEKRRFGKVQGITWLSNGLVLVLGLLSLYEGSGVFFKLQPAIFMIVFAGILLGSSVVKRPFLVEAARKQNPDLPPIVVERLRGMNVRVGILFIALSVLCVHSALYWSTAAWAALKGVGLPLLTGAYMVIEVLVIRLTQPRPPGAGSA